MRDFCPKLEARELIALLAGAVTAVGLSLFMVGRDKPSLIVEAYCRYGRVPNVEYAQIDGGRGTTGWEVTIGNTAARIIETAAYVRDGQGRTASSNPATTRAASTAKDVQLYLLAPGRRFTSAPHCPDGEVFHHFATDDGLIVSLGDIAFDDKRSVLITTGR